MNTSRVRSALEITVMLVILGVCVTLLWFIITNRRSLQTQVVVRPPVTHPPPPHDPPPPAEPVSIVGAQMKGNPKAKVAIIEFSEFQCPWCGRFYHDTLPDLRKQYVDTGKVLFVFRNLPLEQMHPFALKAAEAAECAGKAGKFWAMHDANFEHQQALDQPSLLQRAKDLGLAPKPFAACLDGEMTAKVRQDAADAQKFSITGTPAFFLGAVQEDGRVKVVQRFSGAKPFKDFQGVLDKLLAVATAAAR